jgi:hypothetical protein
MKRPLVIITLVLLAIPALLVAAMVVCNLAMRAQHG